MLYSNRSPGSPPTRFGMKSAATLCLLSVLSAVCADESGPSWIRDLEKAKNKAKSKEKDLLVVFTGRGWCQPCELLDQRVFQNPDFVKAAGKPFLFVELDFNFGDTELEKRRQTEYGQLKHRYLVLGYPTIVLTDAAGLPYAKMAGYSKDAGPDRMILKMEKARHSKKIRDDCFGKANSSPESRLRVRHLHDGIQAIAHLLGSLEDNGGNDPVLSFYGRKVEEILKSTQASGVRDSYIARKKAQELWLTRPSTVTAEKLQTFVAAGDYKGGIDYIDSILKKEINPETVWNLQLTRQGYFEADGNHEAAIRNAEHLAKSRNIPERIRERILDSQARSFACSGRLPEAIMQYDRRIESSTDNKQTLRLLYRKAALVEFGGKLDQTAIAWKAYRDFSKPHSVEWLNGTTLLARTLQKLERYQDASVLFGQIFETLETQKRQDIVLKWPWSEDPHLLWLEAANCHLALGQHNTAKELISRTENGISLLQASARNGDKEFAERLQKIATALTEEMKNVD